MRPNRDCIFHPVWYNGYRGEAYAERHSKNGPRPNNSLKSESRSAKWPAWYSSRWASFWACAFSSVRIPDCWAARFATYCSGCSGCSLISCRSRSSPLGIAVIASRSKKAQQGQDCADRAACRIGVFAGAYVHIESADPERRLFFHMLETHTGSAWWTVRAPGRPAACSFIRATC